jgi:histidine ammonia-lyase
MEALVLSGKGLTLQDVWDVAYHGRKVEISDDSFGRLAKGREIMQKLANEGKPIYGFNRGVGQNKDVVVDNEAIDLENMKMLRTHALGLPPFNSEEEVRAMMVIRLNNMLIGASCATDELACSYRDFLNAGITPRIPSRGSVGEADITTVTHLGLAFTGQAEVSYKGSVMPAEEAMEKAGLTPLRLRLKDVHTIMLSNGQGEGSAAVLVHETENLLKMSDLIYCLAYEGLNGNIEAMAEDVNDLRGLPGQIECARRCRAFLEGSYLHDEDRPDHALQDPLTFRGGFTVTGAVVDALEFIKKYLSIQINSPSDNPCILLEKGDTSVNSNFETPTLALGVEMLAIALGHLSRTVYYRTIRLGDPAFTGLPRFLEPRDHSSHGYEEVQVTTSALEAETRYLINPSSIDFYPMQGSIEDHASNLPLVVSKCRKIVDNLRYMIGMEAMYAAQAIDLREGGYVKLGKATQPMYDMVREAVPALHDNRDIYSDIQKMYEMMRSEEPMKIVDSVL